MCVLISFFATISDSFLPVIISTLTPVSISNDLSSFSALLMLRIADVAYAKYFFTSFTSIKNLNDFSVDFNLSRFFGLIIPLLKESSPNRSCTRYKEFFV